MNPAMTSLHAHLRILMIEDSEDDARLLHSELGRTAGEITFRRVENAEDMRGALSESDWDIVISDHALPQFSSLEALQVLKECGKDIPFIIYSGEVSEHVVVAAMYSGAHDSIHKGNFARLLPAIERDLNGASTRRAREDADREVRKLAFYDSLTDMPNRNLFCSHVGRKLSDREGQSAAVLVLDVDRFLRINNCFGRKIGDALMRQIGRRLEECVPEDGMAARLNSDEFAVYLGAASSEIQTRQAAETLRQVFVRPFTEGTLEFFISVSIGIAASCRDGQDVQELLTNAETAMFRAKELGGNSYQFYVQEMGVIAGGQLMLESSLRKAVARNELVLEYQPCLDVVTGKLNGVEALVRWRHPELGMLQPDEFIPIANESGLITEIGKWVLENACRQAKRWHDSGYPELRIAINLSSVQFWQPGLAQTVADAISTSGVDPRCIEFEITESVLMRDTEATMSTLHALKRMKVQISVDDFGVGYSSLNYLRHFPIDNLKIDKSFSSDVTHDVETAAIVRAVGALARSLGLLTVAEGVETTEQLEFFREEGYDRVQGFLFSPPRAAADITEMLSQTSSATRRLEVMHEAVA